MKIKRCSQEKASPGTVTTLAITKIQRVPGIGRVDQCCDGSSGYFPICMVPHNIGQNENTARLWNWSSVSMLCRFQWILSHACVIVLALSLVL